jgi:hypothetical protein
MWGVPGETLCVTISQRLSGKMQKKPPVYSPILCGSNRDLVQKHELFSLVRRAVLVIPLSVAASIQGRFPLWFQWEDKYNEKL